MNQTHANTIHHSLILNQKEYRLSQIHSLIFFSWNELSFMSCIYTEYCHIKLLKPKITTS